MKQARTPHLSPRTLAGRIVSAASLALACSAFAQVVPAKPISPETAQPGGAARPVMPGTSGAVTDPVPGASPAAQPGDLPSISTDDPNTITLAAFTEPVQLSTLIELVGQTLHVNITATGDVPGSVVFNAPVPIPKSELINLLNSLLEQQGWTISRNRFGWYTVQQVTTITAQLGADHSTTRVFSTPNLRPSALKQPIEAVMNAAQGGQPARQYAYVDDLGIIVATDTPQRLSSLGDIVDRIIQENSRTAFTRLELSHISASVARERALQLVGQASQSSGNRIPGQPDPNAAANAARGFVSLNNLGERLWADPQGNALILAGLPQEADQIRKILTVIDVPNALTPKAYDVGSSAGQIADIARGRGLGEVITIGEFSGQEGLGGNQQFNRINQGNQFNGLGANTASSVGGPVMLADERRGKIIYYGTPAQQEQLADLIKELDTQSDLVITQVYKLRNSDAEDVAEIINGLLSNSTPVGTGTLLPGAEQGGTPRGFRAGGNLAGRNRTNQNPTNQQQQPRTGQMPAGEDGFNVDSTNAFVIAVPANNQLLVKAEAGQQPQFARLIEKLDVRRPQVYIEAKIVAVTADDRLRIAFENQLINASGTGGVLNTNFGLSSFATGTGITGRKTVATGLGGLTAAIIKSDQVPIVMNALGNETDSRIVSNPQLLVDDNEEAEVVSLDQQPTSTISRGTNGSGDIVTPGDYVEAGTTLNVKPQISGGGYLRLKYNIELSSFTGTGQTVGGTTLPPPKQTNNIKSESITVPSDSTVVIGGLVVDAKTKTIAKIPLIGDIPLVGLLFQDRNTGDRKTVLYVFLTPRILQEPTFSDLKLLTKGPQSVAKLPRDVPELGPSLIPIAEPGTQPAQPRPALPAPARSTTPPADQPPRPYEPQPAAVQPAAPAPPATTPPGEQPGTPPQPSPD